MLNAGLSRIYKFDASRVYFDCKNFYFEIDREDEYRKKGPSKEKRTDPLVRLGLLLDKNCIPVTMQLYPGNESEIYRLNECINEAKKQNILVDKTIHVADKGLNCARNIYEAKKSNNGYIFSKSVYKLSDKELKWVLLEDNEENKYTDIFDDNGELIFRYKTCIDDFEYSFEEKDENNINRTIKFEVAEKRILYWSKALHDKKIYELNNMKEKLANLILSKAKKEEYGNYSSYVTIETKKKDGQKGEEDIKVSINEDKFKKGEKLAGYNLLVTSEIKEDSYEIYKVYHELWRIEDTFRTLKNDLNARPSYLQKKEKINGHLLVCYTGILLLRILQLLVLKNKLTIGEVLSFIRNASLIKDQEIIINLLKANQIKNEIKEAFPLDYEYRKLSEKFLEEMFNYNVSIPK